MLAEALTKIKLSLAGEFAAQDFDLGNIATLSSETPPVTLTLLNLKEEPALKNTAYSRINNATLKTEYFNPYVYLNAYLMFCSSRKTYSTAVGDIAKIIRALQGNSIFMVDYDGDQYKVILSIYSPTFEDMNHIWGVLGGKVYPNIIYIMRVAELKKKEAIAEGDGIIENIEQKYSVIQPKS
ncbi:DUF4255 domain-containing protein [Chitinophaga sp. Hz27]|uniref:DUF4255 domain-containing protein n=1 Tax=Chitinophaga sp. Hz27 TaxID=3347169 RepID=UPI0035DAF231